MTVEDLRTRPQPDIATSSPRAAAKAGDRRMFRRYATGIAAWLECDGERLDCRIVDISLGGAAISPPIPSRHGCAVRLCCEMFHHPPGMIGRLVGGDTLTTSIAFVLDAPAEDALSMFLVASSVTRARGKRSTDR